MKHPWISWFCLLLCWFSPAHAELFSEANEFSRSGQYEKAAVLYEQLYREQGPSLSLLYNRGTNAQRGEHWAEAILCYERALQLSPRDEAVRHNLRLVRQHLSVEPAVLLPRSWAPLAMSLSRSEWSILLVLAAWCIALTSVLIFLAGKSRFSWRYTAMAATFFSVILIVVASMVLRQRQQEDQLAVVMAKDVALLLSPFEKAEQLNNMPEGSIVMVEQTRGDYDYIHIPGTELRGWVQGDKIERIIE